MLSHGSPPGKQGRLDRWPPIQVSSLHGRCLHQRPNPKEGPSHECSFLGSGEITNQVCFDLRLDESCQETPTVTDTQLGHSAVPAVLPSDYAALPSDLVTPRTRRERKRRSVPFGGRGRSPKRRALAAG